MFKKQLKSISLAAALFAVAMGASASVKDVESKIKSNYKNINLQKVVELKGVNLYEITFLVNGAKQHAFTNNKVDYLFLSSGEILDLKNNKNVTADRQEARSVELFNSLPFNSAIAVKYGKGTNKVAVFSDPDCPYCQTMDQDFHQNLKDDVTIYYFMNPLSSIHPEAAKRATRILCDANPSQAWVKYMTSAPGLNSVKNQTWKPESALPQNNGDCKNGEAIKTVSNHYDIATENSFLSTPTVIFSNGLTFKDKLTSNDVSLVLKNINKK